MCVYSLKHLARCDARNYLACMQGITVASIHVPSVIEFSTTGRACSTIAAHRDLTLMLRKKKWQFPLDMENIEL